MNATFNVIKNVEENDNDGGYIVVEVKENDVVRNVEFSFDFGGSLCSCEIVDENGEYNGEKVEDVFSEEVVEMIWGMEFDF